MKLLVPVALALGLAACHGGKDTDGTSIGAGDDDDDATTGPIARRCLDPGPDAPVTPAVTPTFDTFEGDPVQYWLPDGLRAVVFYFYGGDDVSEWNGYEQTAFANQMADANIGWVAYTKATPQASGSWDDTREDWVANDDLARLDRLRNELVATTPLSDGTPIVSVGFSDGASFSVFFATAAQRAGWPVAVVLAHNSGARGNDLPDCPMWTTASENDDANVRNGSADLAQAQADRGFLAVHHPVDERLAPADVFLRNPEWDATKAQELFDDLVTAGLVDASGARTVADDQMDAAISAWTRNPTVRGGAIAGSRLRVVWATHRYSAFHTVEECEFVLDALGL
ncbi:MAG: hypothetical protein R3F59_12360 [Myxococcota bacterium]